MWQYTMCKLENQESQWYNSVQTLRPENKESHGIALSPRLRPKNVGRGTGVRPGIHFRPKNQELQRPRAGEDECPSSKTERENLSFPPSFCAIQAPNESDDVCPHW